MQNAPWLMLAVLVLVRTSLGMQFQSIGSLGPLLMQHLSIDFAALGMLIGAYHFPGVFVVLPIGWANARYGDRLLVLSALALMTLGASGLALAPALGLALIARLVGGIGAAGLNTVLTKMALDRFTGASLTLAIGFLMGAWPLGQALALMSLPPIAAAAGWRIALGIAAGLCAVGFLAMILVLPRGRASVEVPQRVRIPSHEVWPLLTAAFTWAGFNAALTIVLGFAPTYFAGHGLSTAEAGRLVGLVSLPLVPLIPLGGWLSRFTNRPVLTVGVFLAAIMAAILVLPFTREPGLVLLVLGFLMGTPVALMVAMPARVLAPESRAIGMGLFYLVFNANVAVLPAVAGWARDTSGLAAAPFYTAAACLAVALLTLGGFALTLRRLPAVETEGVTR